MAKSKLVETVQGTELIVVAQTDAAIADLRSVVEVSIEHLSQTYGAATIKDTKDREGLKLVEEGWRTTRNLRLAVEKRRKELIEPALEFQRAINAEAKEITASLESVELPLKAELDRIERVKADEKKAEEERIARIFTARTGMLFSIGATFNGNIYQLGTAITSPEEIRDAEDAAFDSIMQKFTAEKTRQDELKAAEAARLKAEAEATAARLKAEAEEAERKRAELAEKQAQVEALNLKLRSAQLLELGAVAYFNDEGKKAGLQIGTKRASATIMRTTEDYSWDGVVFPEFQAEAQRVKEQAERDRETAETAAQVRAEAEARKSAEVAPEPPQPETPATDMLKEAAAKAFVPKVEPTTPTNIALEVIAKVRAAFDTCKTRGEFKAALDTIEAEYAGEVSNG